MTDQEMKRHIREIKTLVEDVDAKIEYLIEKMGEMFYRR